MPHHLSSLKAYRRIRAEVGFRCRCGVRKVALPKTLIEAFGVHADPADIARRMRCGACGRKTVTAYAVLPDSIVPEPKVFKAVWGVGQGEKE